MLKKDMQYLVIDVKKVDVMEIVAAQGEPRVWVDVEWGGMRKLSK